MVLRPRDAARLKEQRDTIFKNTGFTVVWRKYVSSAGGAPDFGIEPLQSYSNDRKIQVLIGAPTLEDVQTGGGFLFVGEIAQVDKNTPVVHLHSDNNF